MFKNLSLFTLSGAAIAANAPAQPISVNLYEFAAG